MKYVLKSEIYGCYYGGESFDKSVGYDRPEFVTDINKAWKSSKEYLESLIKIDPMNFRNFVVEEVEA